MREVERLLGSALLRGSDCGLAVLLGSITHTTSVPMPCEMAPVLLSVTKFKSDIGRKRLKIKHLLETLAFEQVKARKNLIFPGVQSPTLILLHGQNYPFRILM